MLLPSDILANSLLWTARIFLLLLLAAVCISDLRQRRIPNRLVVIGLTVALLWQAVAPVGAGLFDAHDPGALGFTAALVGTTLAFAGFLVLYLLSIMGAGDVKLMAMLGAFFGASVLPTLIILIFLTGGVLVAVRVFDGERRRAVAANLRVILFGRLMALSGGHGPQFDPRTDTADRLPIALAIAGGALVTAVLQGTGVLA